MKYVEISNLSNKEVDQKLKEVNGVSITVSTKCVNDSQFNRALKLLEVLKKSNFVENEEKMEIGQFGITRFFNKN